MSSMSATCTEMDCFIPPSLNFTSTGPLNSVYYPVNLHSRYVVSGRPRWPTTLGLASVRYDSVSTTIGHNTPSTLPSTWQLVKVASLHVVLGVCTGQDARYSSTPAHLNSSNTLRREAFLHQGDLLLTLPLLGTLFSSSSQVSCSFFLLQYQHINRNLFVSLTASLRDLKPETEESLKLDQLDSTRD